MNRTRSNRYRLPALLAAAALAFLALFPSAFAEPGRVASGGEARAEALRLIDRVVSVSRADPGAPGAVPSWQGAVPGEPLLIHSMDDEPTEYLVPVMDRSGSTVSVIGVSATSGEWLWYSSSCIADSFPGVDAGEALKNAERFIERMGMDCRLPRPRARMEANKNLYWHFDLEDGLPFERLRLPVFAEGEVFTDLDPVPSLKPGVPPVLDKAVPPAGRGADPFPEERDASAVPSQHDIAGVPFHYQEQDVWCGAAALEMIFDYWGPDVPQAEIAGVANTQSEGCYSTDLVRAAQFSSMSRSIQDAGLRGYSSRKMGYMAAQAFWSDSALVNSRYDDLKKLVSSGYPVLVLTWYDAAHTGGHFRVVKGYNDTLGVFIVHDPWYTAPYMGPDVQFNQAFLVDDLWVYSDRDGIVAAPWSVRVTKPGSVRSGQVFEVSATVAYPGPAPLADRFACSSPYAKIELGSDYELLDSAEFKNLSGITYTGSAGTVSWQVRAKKDKSDTGDITVSAQGRIEGSSKSYDSYQDVVGLGTRFNSTSPTWYLAEGSTAWGFDCLISIQNPNPSEVTADVTFMTDSGPVTCAPLKLPAMSQTMVNPASVLGEKDFSTRVVCREGMQIAVDRVMAWVGPGAASGDGHCSIGVTSPARTWYLAEGSSSWGFECWLLIQNPNATEATCEVTYMIEGAGPRTFTKKVPPNSRKTYNMSDDIGSADASIKVVSDLPVIPERAMYRNNRRGGHNSIGTTAPSNDFYLAEGTSAWGFTTYVLIQNPNPSPAEITVTYMTPSGPVPQAPFTIPANERKTIRVNDVLPGIDFSTKVHGSQPIIAERAMYWGAGTPRGEACHDSIGLPEPHTTFYLPSGQASGGAETWTLVQNPNTTDVVVEISYLTPSGKNNPTFQETVPAGSRRTFSMAEKLPSGTAAILVTSKTPGKKIMVERAIYGNNRGSGMNTIGGYSD